MNETTNNAVQLAFGGLPAKKRPIPRPFFFPWGDGQIVEEASVRGEHHEPCIQLLEFDCGFELVRFCSYTLNGRFERNSWIASVDNLHGLTDALKETPRLKQLLLKLLQ